MISALTGPLLRIAAGIIAVLSVYLYAHHTGYNSGVEHQQSLQLVAVQKATEAAQAEQRARDDITLAAAVAALIFVAGMLGRVVKQDAAP